MGRPRRTEMAANNGRRFSLADFIKSERVKRNENEVEDFRTVTSSDDKRSVTSVQTGNDESTEKEEIYALYPLRVRRKQTRHKRHSEMYDASRNSAVQDMVNEELCLKDEDEKNLSPSTQARGYYKRRRRFSVIQDNEGSSFTMEDKIRALQEEGSTHRKKNRRSGRSHTTNRSTISSFPSSAHSRSTSGSVMFGERHETASVQSEMQKEITPNKNTNESNRKVADEADLNNDNTIKDINNDNTIKVEIRRVSSGTKNIVVALQVGDTTQTMKESDVGNYKSETDQSRILIGSKQSQRERISDTVSSNSTDRVSPQIVLIQGDKDLEMKKHESSEANTGELSEVQDKDLLSRGGLINHTVSEDSSTSHIQSEIGHTRNTSMKSPANISISSEVSQLQEVDEVMCVMPQNETSVVLGIDTLPKEDNVQNVDQPNMLNITTYTVPGTPYTDNKADIVKLKDKVSPDDVATQKDDKMEVVEPLKNDTVVVSLKTNKSETEDSKPIGMPQDTFSSEDKDELQNPDFRSSNVESSSCKLREENEVKNVEPTNKIQAEIDSSNQNVNNLNKPSGNGNVETQGVTTTFDVHQITSSSQEIETGIETIVHGNRKNSYEGSYISETGHDESKPKAYANRIKNKELTTSDKCKTDINDKNNIGKTSSKFDQPEPQREVDPLTSSNEEQKASEYFPRELEPAVILSDDTPLVASDQQGVSLDNGSESTESHTNKSPSNRDGEREEKFDDQKSELNNSQHITLQANKNKNKATNSTNINRVTVDQSETAKKVQSVQRKQETTSTSTFVGCETAEFKDGNNLRASPQASQDVRAHNVNVYKTVKQREPSEGGSGEMNDSDQSPGTRIEGTSLRSTRRTQSDTTRTEKEEDRQETVTLIGGKVQGKKSMDTSKDNYPFYGQQGGREMERGNGKDPASDCNRENNSLDDSEKDTGKENDSLRDNDPLSDCDQDTDKKRLHLKESSKDTDKAKNCLNDCKEDTDKGKDRSSDCNQNTAIEKLQLNDCNQDAHKEGESLKDCNIDTNEEKDPIHDCDEKTEKEKVTLDKEKQKEKGSSDDCIEGLDDEKNPLNGCTKDIEKVPCNDCNTDTDGENDLLNDGVLATSKDDCFSNEFTQGIDAVVPLSDSCQDTNNGKILAHENQTQSPEAMLTCDQVDSSKCDETSYNTESKATSGDDSGSKNKPNENIPSKSPHGEQCIQDDNKNIKEDEPEDGIQQTIVPLKLSPLSKPFTDENTEHDKRFLNEKTPPNHISESRTPSLPKIEIVIKNDDSNRKNDLTLVINLPQDGARTREASLVRNMKDQFCQTEENSQKASTHPMEALPPLSCEPPLVQRRERSFVRLHHKPSKEPDSDPEVLYFIRQAELRQRRRIDDIMREIYQIKHADLLEPPLCRYPDYMYPMSRDHHPRFLYDSDPYDSMVVNAVQYDDSVRRFLGYTKRSDRLKAMEHSRKYKAYLDLRKKLKHLY